MEGQDGYISLSTQGNEHSLERQGQHFMLFKSGWVTEKQHKEGHTNEDLATEGTRGELKIEWFLLQMTHISGLR